MNNLSVFLAFLAGVVSFFSPCTFPIIPGYIAFLAGVSLAESKNRKTEVFLASFFFVLGFASVFSLIGIILNTVLAAFAYDAQIWLARLGGVIIILFGIFLTGILNIPFLEKEYKFTPKRIFPSKYLTAFVFGLAFAVSWTPCVGAVLGGILGLAATIPSLAFLLLFAYSLGLGIPFLVVGLFAAQASVLISRYAKFFRYINLIFGVILILVGILSFTQKLILLKWPY